MAKLGLGDKIANPSAKLKWTLNEVKRLALVESELEVIRFHYVDRDAFLCYQDKGMACPYCKQEEYRYRFGINVIVYDMVPATDGSGLLVPSGKFALKMWVFSNTTYEDLSRLKASWGDLTQRDLSVTCVNDQFQNVKVDPLPDSLWMSGAVGKKEDVKAFYDVNKKDVGKFLLNTVVLPGQAPRSRRNAAPGPGAAPADVGAGGLVPLNAGGPGLQAAPVEIKKEDSAPAAGTNLNKLMDEL